MKCYKYEMHTHTADVSRCATITAAELISHYKRHDYSGVCITNHFFNGNTTIKADLSWDDKVSLFASGYEMAAKEGKKYGINVFFGWEYSYSGTDFLTYNLSIQWLRKHPEIMDMHVNDYLDFARSEGGFIVHAHPFREANYIPMIRLFPRKVDGVEVNNSSMIDFVNDLADKYADNYDLLKSVGSDT
ncbi:MAG: histidinol phosphatase, partial [Clostridiales bacterium]|nr:histidinol phosphatase [Clostridiales bacterium]